MKPFPERVLVAGATGGTGLQVIRRLRQLGVSARVLTRDRGRARNLGDLEVVEGDALVGSDCARAIEGCDGVVCSIGERWTPKGRPIVDGAGVINLANAAEKAGARRFVLVSSLGVGDSWERLPFLMKRFFRLFGLVPILEAKGRSEDHLKTIRLDWTVLRPALLTDLRMRAEPFVVRAGLAGGTTTRQGVADVAVRCLASPNTIGAVLTVVDHCMRFTLRGDGPFHPDMRWEQWKAP